MNDGVVEGERERKRERERDEKEEMKREREREREWLVIVFYFPFRCLSAVRMAFVSILLAVCTFVGLAHEMI